MLKKLGEIAIIRTLKLYDEIEDLDILISRNLKKGKLVYNSKDFIKNDIQPKNYFLVKPKSINNEILYGQLNTENFRTWFEHNARAKNVPYIILDDLKKFNVDIPALRMTKDLNYENVIFLDSLNRKDIVNLYKYSPLNRFIENIEKKTLCFVSPETWFDPFETKYWYADYSRYNFVKPEIHCMCLTNKGSENEEAAWKMYSNGDNAKTIKITYNVDKFLSILNDYAKNENLHIYIGKANYNYSIKEIENLYKESSPYHDMFFPSHFNIENFLHIMCLKRRAFTFENEIRVFIVNNSNYNNGKIKVIPNIDYQNGLIKKLKLSPYPPFNYSDPRKKIYKQLQDLESDAIKLQLNEKLPNVDVQQSQLYSSTRSILRV